MINDIERVLISEADLKEKVEEIADAISKEYKGKNLLLISILKGGFIFCADLLRCITIPVRIEFMAVSSYGKESVTSGIVTIKKDVEMDLTGVDVIIVEDIIDSGYTLKYLKELIESRKPNSVKLCTMLNKPSRRKVELCADYVGFDIPDEFVVGYGLDYGEKYRNFPFVGVLKREIYMNNL